MALRTRTPSLDSCGLPSFTFAGFTWPRYMATLPRGTLRERLRDRISGCTGDYCHAPSPNNREGRGFYLTAREAWGLRYRYADEVSGSGIRHYGWFTTDDTCSDTIRGIVLRLPRGRGFLAGWTMGEGMASSFDYSPIFDDEADAAACADSMAKNAAESEREYQERMRVEDEETADEGEA